MAKSKRKGGKPKREDKGKIARRTLSAARFFFDQAGRAEYRDIEHYGYYVGAAIVFARMVLEHLEKEFPGAEQWIKNLEENRPLIRALIDMRNRLSHERPISTIPSQEDILYIDDPSKAAHEMLRNQLNEVETVVEECERLFK